MSATPSNPFVLPGFGQSGDAATNPLMASLEMMRQAFAGLAGPAGMTGGLSLNPPMNPEELERKIAELKSVENWLKLNLSML
ncbi:MAG: PhaM family polyhydroxyalkanoate granule multifunctional regulatory protein, partial [Alcaligenaceae bacterium]